MDNQKNKQARYENLIQKVKTCKQCQDCSAVATPNSVQIAPCKEEFLKEINLWTHWEGGKNNLNAKILLLGQDWGCYEGQKAIENIKNNNHYMKNNRCVTNLNLVELFKQLGYDIENDVAEPGKQMTDLFFSNLVLCYRNKGFSGGFKDKWISNCGEYLRELVEIIEPEVILCLGRKTFEGTLKAFHFDVPKVEKGKSGYSKLIAGDQNPFSITYGAEKREVKIFALAHCGTMGTNNRNYGTGESGLTLQLKDWKKINLTIKKETAMNLLSPKDK